MIHRYPLNEIAATCVYTFQLIQSTTEIWSGAIEANKHTPF
jgi:hypothetical protein